MKQNTQKKTAAARKQRLAATSESLCSAFEMDYSSLSLDRRWGMPMEAAAAGSFGEPAKEPPKKDVFTICRRYHRLSDPIRRVCSLRTAFYNSGVLGDVEVPVDPKDPTGKLERRLHPGIVSASSNPADRRKVEKWKRANFKQIARLVQDVWREWMITRNVVCIWQEGGLPLVRHVETCGYTDLFGVEELAVDVNLTTEAIRKMDLPPKVREKLLKNPKTLKLTHEDDEVFQFAVLKDEGMGNGFGWPDIATMFHPCAELESLLVGDRALADVARTVYEQHLLGHEIKNGNHAGSPVHFANRKRREGVLEEVKGVKGHKLLITNFDHVIKLGAGRPDPSQYDAKRYLAPLERFAMWGAPYVQMLDGTVNPFLMRLAREDAIQERNLVGPFLASVLKDSLNAPVDLAVRFDQSCFLDIRSMLDALKAGLSGGPVSQGTFLERLGFDQADELARKEFESKLPKDLVEPAYDAAHGPPKQAAKPAGGKPPGKNDQV